MISIQEQIVEQKAQEMAREIDREVLWSMLETIGWHRVMLPSFDSTQQYKEVVDWAVANCKHAFEQHKRDYIFESQQDANWFKLRWLA